MQTSINPDTALIEGMLLGVSQAAEIVPICSNHLCLPANGRWNNQPPSIFSVNGEPFSNMGDLDWFTALFVWSPTCFSLVHWDVPMATCRADLTHRGCLDANSNPRSHSADFLGHDWLADDFCPRCTVRKDYWTCLKICTYQFIIAALHVRSNMSKAPKWFVQKLVPKITSSTDPALNT